jgi:tRNA A37 threonylcarbamoyladenosine modification protein TsaB
MRGFTIGFTMVLCIDTATQLSGISLVTSEKSFGYLSLDSRHASDNILKNIDKLLTKSNVELTDLKGVFVIKGPGWPPSRYSSR